MKEIIITNFTDPVCVWCWGTEPVLRALETRYPGDIEVRYVMGGLVKDISDFDDPANGIGGDISLINGQVASHWQESADRHGMPIMTENFRLFSTEYPSTYPLNIACKAAQLASPGLANRYLRRLREATLTQAQLTNRQPVLDALAREVGIDMTAFEQALRDGSAKRAFQTDLGLGQALGVSAFPTFLVKSAQARQILMRGFNTRQDFERVIAQLTDGELKPLASAPEEEVLMWLLNIHGSLAREEVFQAFDFDSREEADRFLQPLIDKGRLVKAQAGTSYLVRVG